MTSSALNYADDEAIELFDRVELNLDDREFDAVVTALLPMSGMVRVMYLDTVNTLRNGDPRRCHMRALPSQISLIRRDG